MAEGRDHRIENSKWFRGGWSLSGRKCLAGSLRNGDCGTQSWPSPICIMPGSSCSRAPTPKQTTPFARCLPTSLKSMRHSTVARSGPARNMWPVCPCAWVDWACGACEDALLSCAMVNGLLRTSQGNQASGNMAGSIGLLPFRTRSSGRPRYCHAVPLLAVLT